MFILWLLHDFIVNVIESGLMYMLLSVFLIPKINSKGKIISIIFFQALTIHIVNIILGVPSILGFFIMIGISILFQYHIFKEHLFKLIVLELLYCIGIALMEISFIAVFEKVFNMGIILVNRRTPHRVALEVITKVLYFIIIKFLEKMKIESLRIKKIYIYEIIVVLMINIVFMFLILKIYSGSKIISTSKYQLEIIFLFMIIFTIVTLTIIRQIIKYSNKEIQWKIREKEYKRQVDYIRKMEETAYKLKAQRHDFNHHIGCIHALAEKNNIEELTKYTEKLIKSIKKVNNIVTVGDPVISAILNYKLSVAEGKNIELKFSIDLPASMTIDPVDMSIILGNILDNAIEACHNTKNKYIELKMYKQNKYLIIKLTNSKKGGRLRLDGKYMTSKDNNENHGFGLENVKYMVEKYDGLFEIEENKESFIVKIGILYK